MYGSLKKGRRIVSEVKSGIITPCHGRSVAAGVAVASVAIQVPSATVAQASTMAAVRSLKFVRDGMLRTTECKNKNYLPSH